MAERIRALWQRLLADIHRNPGLWIGVGISAVILVVAYLAYRKQQNSQQGQVPANGYGYPDYGSATGGSSGGLFGGGYNPGPPNLNFGPNPGTPTPVPPVSAPQVPPTSPGVAQPPLPPFSYSPPPVASPVPPVSVAHKVVGGIQNPLKASQLAHRGKAPGSNGPGLPTFNNPLAASQRAHRGILPTFNNPLAAAQRAHRGIPTPQTQGYHIPIPTTQRPRPVAGRGRQA